MKWYQYTYQHPVEHRVVIEHEDPVQRPDYVRPRVQLRLK